LGQKRVGPERGRKGLGGKKKIRVTDLGCRGSWGGQGGARGLKGKSDWWGNVRKKGRKVKMERGRGDRKKGNWEQQGRLPA